MSRPTSVPLAIPGGRCVDEGALRRVERKSSRLEGPEMSARSPISATPERRHGAAPEPAADTAPTRNVIPGSNLRTNGGWPTPPARDGGHRSRTCLAPAAAARPARIAWSPRPVRTTNGRTVAGDEMTLIGASPCVCSRRRSVRSSESPTSQPWRFGGSENCADASAPGRPRYAAPSIRSAARIKSRCPGTRDTIRSQQRKRPLESGLTR